MVTLSFIVCMTTGCFTNGPPNIFPSVAVCEEVAASIMTTNLLKMESGELPPHTVAYKCIEWSSYT